MYSFRNKDSTTKHSLKVKFLLYLTAVALIFLSLGTVDAYRIAKDEIKQQLLSRAQLLASAIHHASMIADSNAEMEHFASQVMVDNPQIESLILISNTSSDILFEMHNKGYSFEQTAQLKALGFESLQDNYFSAHYLSDEYLFIFSPLEVQQKPLLAGDMHSDHVHEKALQHTNHVNFSANSDPSIGKMRMDAIGAVLLAFEKRTISKGVNPILLRVLPTSVVGIMMMLILCYLLLHIQVIKPIGVIRTAMIKQQSGDHSARALLDSTIEIDDMALSLNSMLDTIKDREDQIKKLAMTDPLTGLDNRASFHNELDKVLKEARSEGSSFAVAYIDLDRFKSVNDTHGHQVGDLMLKAVAKVLTTQTRHQDTVARLGGDEFAIIAVGVSQIDGIRNRLLNIIEDVSKTNHSCAYATNIGASIGIAFYPTDGIGGDELIGRADAALYQAKESGRGTFCIYQQQASA